MKLSKATCAILFFLGIVLLFCNPALSNDKEYRLALSASFTGVASDAGTSFRRAAELAINEINKQGGVNGHQITISFYDDQNDPEKGKEIAREIVNGNYHAVIGHHYSDVSLAAGPIYRDAGLPVISAASTADGITIDNPWYFRTIFSNDAQAKFIANYINQVFSNTEIAIITDSAQYGSGLTDSFLETASALNLNAFQAAVIQQDHTDVIDQIKQAAEELYQDNFEGIIFLASHAPIGADIVRILRDEGLQNTIFVPDAFAAESFTNRLSEQLEGTVSLQFYTRNIFVASPIIFDSANQPAQQFFDEFVQSHNASPDWRAAYTYDTVIVLAEVLKNLQPTQTLTDTREEIRAGLANINTPEKAVAGITGLNFFDENGDIQKPVVIGNYNNSGLSSALTQFSTIPAISEISNLERDLNEGSIVRFNDTFMYRTDVVFTGIKPRQIRNFSPDTGLFDMEFDIWLRHQGNTNVTDIEFLNSENEVSLGEPIYRKDNGTYVYELFRIKDTFKINFTDSPPAFRHFHLGTSIRHKRTDRGNLIYVSDLTGMGFMENESAVDQFLNDRVLGQNTIWVTESINAFSDVQKVSSKGNPEHILKSSSQIPFSTFSYVVELSRDTITVKGFLPKMFVGWLFGISAITIILLMIFSNKVPKHYKSILSIVALFTMLLSGDQLFTDEMVGILDIKFLYLNEKVFQILWIILPAILFTRIIEWYVWQVIEEKTERKIPRLVRGITFLVILSFAGFIVIAFVFNQRLTSLLATSGLAAMIIGLAIQVNLANIFSGLALNIERPFRVGDWVQIGNNTVGKVTEINWRTTRIFTLFDNTISIPNAKVTEEFVENYNYPIDRHYAGFTLYIDHAHEPEKVIKLLKQAVHETEGYMEDWVVFSDYVDWAAEYKCFGAISDYSTHYVKKSALLQSIRKVLKQNNISLAVRRQDIKMIDDHSDLKTIL